MKSLILVLSTLLLLTSCGDDIVFPTSTTSSPLPDIPGDLTFIKGGAKLGRGINSSSTANQFIDCTTSFTNLPFISKKWLVAFGGSPTVESFCGDGCTTNIINCQPGETITTTSTFFPQSQQTPGAISTPADYDLIIGGPGTGPMSGTPDIVDTCPASGKLEQAFSNTLNYATYLKVTVTKISGNDSEYLKCQ